MIKLNIDIPKRCYGSFCYDDCGFCNVLDCHIDSGMPKDFNALTEIRSDCPLIIDKFDEKLNKLKLEFEKANEADDRFTVMEEAEEFMDGEMIYSSGIAKGRYLGLRKALEIIEGMTVTKNIENVSKELIDRLEEIKPSESAWEILLNNPKGVRCTK